MREFWLTGLQSAISYIATGLLMLPESLHLGHSRCRRGIGRSARRFENSVDAAPPTPSRDMSGKRHLHLWIFLKSKSNWKWFTFDSCQKNIVSASILYTTEGEDKIIDSESCVNVREWCACVNFEHGWQTTQYACANVCCVRVWTVWDLQQTTFDYTRQVLKPVFKTCLV